MLREIHRVSQRSVERRKRWFQDEYFDLFIWRDDAGIAIAFQLTYDRKGAERALTWTAGSGFSHRWVIPDSPMAGHPSSPVIGGRAPFMPHIVLPKFAAHAADLDASLVALVVATAGGYYRDLMGSVRKPRRRKGVAPRV